MSEEKLLYKTHVFCCINEKGKKSEKKCCKFRGAEKLRDYMKEQAKKLGIKKIRVNKAGCLDRCDIGPVMVIYPEGVWYSYDNKDDVDEILQKHIIEGGRVERLRITE